MRASIDYTRRVIALEQIFDLCVNSDGPSTATLAKVLHDTRYTECRTRAQSTCACQLSNCICNLCELRHPFTYLQLNPCPLLHTDCTVLPTTTESKTQPTRLFFRLEQWHPFDSILHSTMRPPSRPKNTGTPTITKNRAGILCMPPNVTGTKAKLRLKTVAHALQHVTHCDVSRAATCRCDFSAEGRLQPEGRPSHA